MITVTNIGTNINTGASTATIAVTVPSGGVPLGSLIVVCTGENIALTNGSCSDSKSNTYNIAVSSLRGSGIGTGIIFYSYNSTALVSGDTITYTLSGLHSAAMSACYIQGVNNAADPKDTTGSNSGQSNAPTVTSGTPSNAGDVFVAFVSENSAAGLTSFTQDSSNANWQIPPNSTFSGGVEGLYGGSVVNNSATTRTYAPTPSVATTPNWAALIVSFSAGQVQTYDQPLPPRGATPSTSLKTHISESSTTTLFKQDKFFTSAGRGPTYDYPNPIPPRPSILLKTWIDNLDVEVFGKDRFFYEAGRGPNYDWPNPQLPRRSIDLWSWLQSNTRFPDGLFPSNSIEWYNPWSTTPVVDEKTWTQSPILITTFVPRIDQYDWPNPKGPRQPVVDWIKYTIPQGSPVVQTYTWDNPKGSQQFDKTWIQQGITSSTVVTTYLPSTATEWLNPWNASRSIDLLSWLQTTPEPTIVVVGREPGYFKNWAASTNPYQVSSFPLYLIGQDKVGANNIDWPNPKGALRSIDLLSWLQNSPQVAAVYFPSSNTSWLNPWSQSSNDLRSLSSAGLSLPTFVPPPVTNIPQQITPLGHFVTFANLFRTT